MKKVLVAYASTTGSTEEAARLVARELTARGLAAEALRFSEVGSLEGYDAAVLGAPINGMRWLPEAAGFAASRAADLKGRPVACFYLSYIAFAGGREAWKRSIGRNMGVAAASVGAFSVGAFPGRLAKPLPAFARWLFGTRADAPADLFDPAAARAWAAEIAQRLGA